MLYSEPKWHRINTSQAVSLYPECRPRRKLLCSWHYWRESSCLMPALKGSPVTTHTFNYLTFCIFGHAREHHAQSLGSRGRTLFKHRVTACQGMTGCVKWRVMTPVQNRGLVEMTLKHGRILSAPVKCLKKLFLLDLRLLAHLHAAHSLTRLINIPSMLLSVSHLSLATKDT